MRRHNGFTLVELLVVVAIIALLISILIPSLMAAKDIAKAVFCKSTLSALNKATLLYVEGNKGFMMVMNPKQNASDPTRGPDEPHNASMAFGSMKDINGDGVREAANPDPATGLSADLRTWGFVYTSTTQYKAEMFYCPGTGITAANYIRSTYPDPWGSKSLAISQEIRTSYMWNPWLKSDDSNVTKGSMGYYYYEDDLVFARHPNDRFTTCDLIFGLNATAHQQGKIAKWNMGYPDGHVETLESDASNTTSLWYELSIDLPKIPIPPAPANSQNGIAAEMFREWGVMNMATGGPYKKGPGDYMIRQFLPGK
jgi:prepilin-type N-terminal cleavage/methylation domain-containing protein